MQQDFQEEKFDMYRYGIITYRLESKSKLNTSLYLSLVYYKCNFLNAQY